MCPRNNQPVSLCMDYANSLSWPLACNVTLAAVGRHKTPPAAMILAKLSNAKQCRTYRNLSTLYFLNNFFWILNISQWSPSLVQACLDTHSHEREFVKRYFLTILVSFRIFTAWQKKTIQWRLFPALGESCHMWDLTPSCIDYIFDFIDGYKHDIAWHGINMDSWYQQHPWHWLRPMV